MNNQNMNRNIPMGEDRYKLIYDISVVDFVIVEMTEYLDTHPLDREGIDYVKRYIMLKDKLMKDFAHRFYPLALADAQGCTEEWKSGRAPLPWEGRCK